MIYRYQVDFSARFGDIQGVNKYLASQEGELMALFRSWVEKNPKYAPLFPTMETLHSVRGFAQNENKFGFIDFKFNFGDPQAESAERVLKFFLCELMDSYGDWLSDFMASVIFDVRPENIKFLDVVESKNKAGSVVEKILAGSSVRSALLESAVNPDADRVYSVTGYFDTYARTEDEAKNNLLDAAFGDLYDVSYEKEYEEETEDGERNDLLHVTYEVTGLIDIPDENLDDPESFLKDSDFGELTDVEWRKTYLKVK